MKNVYESFATYPYSWWEDNKDSVEDDQDGEKAQKKEPEPEEDVDLLIHWWRDFKFKIFTEEHLNSRFFTEEDLNSRFFTGEDLNSRFSLGKI